MLLKLSYRYVVEFLLIISTKYYEKIAANTIFKNQDIKRLTATI
jgi:hypothetical protein